MRFGLVLHAASWVDFLIRKQNLGVSMSHEILILLSFIFLAVSIFFSMLGQGGGAFYVPMLLAASVPFYVSAATSQVLIMVVSLSSMLVFAKAKMLDWKLVLLIEPPTNLGSFLGGYLSDHIPSYVAKLCFAGVLLVGAYFMYKPVKEPAHPASDWHWWNWRRTGVAEPYTMNVLILVPIMIVAGFVAGLLGVGGGLVKVPAVVLLGGVPMKIAVGSSSLMIGITALTGFVGHLLQGHFDLNLTAALAVGVLVGSQIGPRLSVKIDPTKLKKFFAVLLFAIALWLIYGVVQ
jgi:uncharacterized membrane protein YfcA